MKCLECPNEATSGMAINIPSAGVPPAEDVPVRIIINYPICSACFVRPRSAEIQCAVMRKAVTELHMNQGTQPDFKRAFCSEVSRSPRAATHGRKEGRSPMSARPLKPGDRVYFVQNGLKLRGVVQDYIRVKTGHEVEIPVLRPLSSKIAADFSGHRKPRIRFFKRSELRKLPEKGARR